MAPDIDKYLLRVVDTAVGVPLTYLAINGIGKEIYEAVHNFPVGSHIPETAGALGALGVYLAIRKKLKHDLK